MRSLNITPRVAIVGAGPQGLTAAVYLTRAGVRPEELLVVDPSGRWLHDWRRSFVQLGIAHLRSPGVHHPDPDPYALIKYAQATGRSAELVEKYGLPSTGLFDDFCCRVLDDCSLIDIVHADSVVGATAEGVLHLAGGEEIRAQHVVWATNPAVRSWDSPHCGVASATVVAWDAVDGDAAGDTVAVVGGGLTAAHLVERAVESGRRALWLTRRRVVVREFDTDAGWLGPRNMNAFDRLATPQERLDAVAEARGGGTVPSWMVRRLRRAEAMGALVRRVGRVSLNHDPRWGDVVCVDGEPVAADQVWLAMGDRPDVAASPVLGELCTSLSVPVVMGRPALDSSLRLPGSVVQVLGRLAQLRLGPTAGNLAGARRGAERVIADVVGVEAMYDLMGV